MTLSKLLRERATEEILIALELDDFSAEHRARMDRHILLARYAAMFEAMGL